MTIGVILALHQPDAAGLAALLRSIAAQRDVAVQLFAAGEAGDLRRPEIARLLTGAECLPRPAGETIGQRFVAGLGAALGRADIAAFAFCDQDDVWHDDKLRASLDLIRSAQAGLVHCDARVVGGDGVVIAPSLHRLEGRREAPDQAALLLRNTVSGFTALFTRQVAERLAGLAPAAPAGLLHDHLAALVAMGHGGVARLPRVLADYRQHGANAIGARAAAPLLGGWLLGLGDFRRKSAAILQQRLEIARLLAAHGEAAPEVAALAASSNHRRLRLLAALAGLGWRQLRRGDWRRLRDCLRLIDGATHSAASH
jgi:hypothetical protein